MQKWSQVKVKGQIFAKMWEFHEHFVSTEQRIRKWRHAEENHRTFENPSGTKSNMTHINKVTPSQRTFSFFSLWNTRHFSDWAMTPLLRKFSIAPRKSKCVTNLDSTHSSNVLWINIKSGQLNRVTLFQEIIIRAKDERKPFNGRTILWGT